MNIKPNGKSRFKGAARLSVRSLTLIFTSLFSFAICPTKAAAQETPLSATENGLQGRTGDIASFKDRYNSEILKKAVWIKPALKVLLGKDYDLFEENFQSESPAELHSGFIVLHGNRPHDAPEHAVVAISVGDKKVHCAIVSESYSPESWSIRVYSEDKQTLPAALLLADAGLDLDASPSETAPNAIGSAHGSVSADAGKLTPPNEPPHVPESLDEHGGYLGARVSGVVPEEAEKLGFTGTLGALVVQVLPGSPAEKSGIKTGDVIRAFGGKGVDNVADLLKLVAATDVGAKVELGLLRGSKPTNEEVTIEERPSNLTTANAEPKDLNPDPQTDQAGEKSQRQTHNLASDGPQKQPDGPSGLQLETSLQGGPSSEVIEHLLQKFVAKDPSFFQFPFLGEEQQSRLTQAYQEGWFYTMVRAAKITNEYTRQVADEEFYVYDLDIDVKMAGITETALGFTFKNKASISVGIVKRGRMWYMEPVP